METTYVNLAKPDIYDEITIHYLDSGLLIVSSFDANEYGISDHHNFEVPVTIILNEHSHFQVLQGIRRYLINNMLRNHLDFNRYWMGLRTDTNNWVIFIPIKGSQQINITDSLKKILGVEVKEYYRNVTEDNDFNYNQIPTQKHLTLTFGLITD